MNFKTFHTIFLLFYVNNKQCKIKIHQDAAFMPFVLLPKLFQIVQHILNKYIIKKSSWAYILKDLEKM